MSEEIPPELVNFRAQIDAIDTALVDLLAQRFDVVRQVGEFKRIRNMDAVQPVRAQAVKDSAVSMGVQQGLDEAFMRKLYDALIDYAHDIEHEILGEEAS